MPPSLMSVRPATIDSTVDLPQPEWPISETNSPLRIFRLKPSTTVSGPLRRRIDLVDVEELDDSVSSFGARLGRPLAGARGSGAGASGDRAATSGSDARVVRRAALRGRRRSPCRYCGDRRRAGAVNVGSWFIAARSRGRGRSTANSRPSVAPGPGVSGMMRSASSMRLVHVVGDQHDGLACPAARCARSRPAAWRGSARPARDSGSSSSSISGSIASARATATRWRMPPDSSAGRAIARRGSGRPSRCSCRRAPRARPAASPGTRRRPPARHCRRTVSQGISE